MQISVLAESRNDQMGGLKTFQEDVETGTHFC
jgi:hypothetical protein